MREEENIEALSSAILREAQDEAEQIQTEAKAKVEAIRQRAQEQAETESKAILERARAEAERLHGQVIASAHLKARTMQLEHREKLLDKVFEAARQKLPVVQQRSDYGKIAAQLLWEAVTQLKAKQAEVRVDDATMKSFEAQKLEQISKELNAQLTMGKPLESGHGVSVEASDGRLHYDNTLESRLERSQNVLRSSVYKVLLGEKL